MALSKILTSLVAGLFSGSNLDDLDIKDDTGAAWTRDGHAEPSPTFHEYSSFGSAIDLTRNGLGYCRQLIPHGSGSMVIVALHPVTGDSAGSTVTVSDGVPLDVEATSIVSVSGPTSVTVLW